MLGKPIKVSSNTTETHNFLLQLSIGKAAKYFMHDQPTNKMISGRRIRELVDEAFDEILEAKDSPKDCLCKSVIVTNNGLRQGCGREACINRSVPLGSQIGAVPRQCRLDVEQLVGLARGTGQEVPEIVKALMQRYPKLELACAQALVVNVVSSQQSRAKRANRKSWSARWVSKPFKPNPFLPYRPEGAPATPSSGSVVPRSPRRCCSRMCCTQISPDDVAGWRGLLVGCESIDDAVCRAQAAHTQMKIRDGTHTHTHLWLAWSAAITFEPLAWSACVVQVDINLWVIMMWVMEVK